MHSPQSSVKVATAWLEAVWLTATVWLLRGYIWPWLSPAEVSPLQAALDPTLFRHDFFVQESLRFTPRFYYNALILLPARAGLPLAATFAIWQLLALGGLIAGVRQIGRALGLDAAAQGVLVLWTLYVGVGELGMVFLYDQGPVPAVWAGAIAVWGIAAALRERWKWAYGCFGAAALLQFLVGFYAGLLLLPMLLRPRDWRRALPAVTLWGIGLALVYVPYRISEAADPRLTGSSFVELYALFRHPHHLVPTKWGLPAWVQAGLFYLGGLWCCMRLELPRPMLGRRWLAIMLVAMTALLAVNYLGVEVWPTPLAAVLQPARCTPFVQLAMLAVLAGVVQARWTKGDCVGSVLLALAPLSPFPGFLFMLAAILLFGSDVPSWWRLALLAAATFFAFHGGVGFTAPRTAIYGRTAGTAAALLVTPWLARSLPRLSIAAGISCAVATVGAITSQSPVWPRTWGAHFAVDAAPFDAVGRLGARFAVTAPKNACVLVPPGGDTWTFKLYSRRAVVVDEKNFPFTARGIVEWKRRMEEVLGQSLRPGLDVVAVWQQSSPDRLAAVAHRYGAQYLLTRDEWHPRLAGHREDTEEGWCLWRLDGEEPTRAERPESPIPRPRERITTLFRDKVPPGRAGT